MILERGERSFSEPETHVHDCICHAELAQASKLRHLFPNLLISLYLFTTEFVIGNTLFYVLSPPPA
jgi:hypothetical protein